MRKTALLCIMVAAVVCGCASIETSDPKGFAYYDAKPYFFVSTTTDCVSTAQIVNIPNEKKYLKFHSGYGSSALTADFDGTMLKSIGQTSDNKAAETITGIAAAATAIGALKEDLGKGTGSKPAKGCKAEAALYSIVDGRVDEHSAIPFPVDPAE